MARIIPVVNQKGGIGKTTVCRNLGYLLSEEGNKVLMVDMDPQCNLGSSLLSAKELKKLESTGQKNMYHLLTQQAEIEECIVHTKSCDVILASNLMYGLAGTPMIEPEDFERMAGDTAAVYDFVKKRYEMQNDPMTDDRHLLCRSLARVADQYDYILIDSNPNLGFLTTLCLFSGAVVYPLVPVFPEESSRKSIIALNTTIRTIMMNDFQQDIRILGLLISRYEKTIITSQYVGHLKKTAAKMETILFHTKIPKGIIAQESMALKKSVFEQNAKSNVSLAYREFFEEFKIRMEQIAEV